MQNRDLILALTVCCALILAPRMPALATDSLPPAASQQEEAREAVRRGIVRPLEEVLAEVRKSIVGDIVEIEFEKDDGRYIYEIEYVDPDGHLMEIKIDAGTLAVISVGEEDED